MLDRFLDALKDEGPNLPNSFTVKLGELIRDARVEAHLSQAELALRVYLRQSSISNIEKGLRAVSAEELLYLIFALNKPVTYFFPEQVTQDLAESDLTILEKELLIQARRLNRDDLRRVIAQSRALAELAPSRPEYEGKTPTEIAKSIVGKSIDLPGRKRRKQGTSRK